MEWLEDLTAEFSKLHEVEALALAGSGMGRQHDAGSDYEIYVYCIAPISEHVRKKILKKSCSVTEIGNCYWEMEDDCLLKTGGGLTVIYRNLEEFSEELAKVVEEYQASNGYSTCLWNQLLNGRILYDEYERLEKLKKRFNVPYPDKLRKNIIRRNWDLIQESLSAYSYQIKQAVLRSDKVALVCNLSGFFDSYFDILLALNRVLHPGGKLLVEFCKKNCTKLPENFEKNLNQLFDDLYMESDQVDEDIQRIARELRKILVLRNSLVFR